jgi:hypothetical protein
METSTIVKPAGAERMARHYYDASGRRKRVGQDVPVNINGELSHRGFDCRKCTETRWFPAQQKGTPVCPVHGGRMSATKLKPPPLLPYKDIWSAVRHPLRPVWALAGMAATAAAVNGAHVPAWEVLVATPVVMQAARMWTGKRLVAEAKRRGSFDVADPQDGLRARRRIGRRVRNVGAAVGAAGVWVASASALGLDGSTAGGDLMWWTLPVVWGVPAALQYRRWREERRTLPPVFEEEVEPEPTPEGPRMLEAERVARLRWGHKVAQRIGDPVVDDSGRPVNAERDGRLAGARLEHWHPIEGGWAATIVGPIGAYGSDEYMASRASIAKAMSMKTSMITIVPDGDDENIAQVMAQRTSPISGNVYWEGPSQIDPVKGTAVFARYMDGTWVNYEIYRPEWGNPHAAFFGTTGSGKALALDTPIPTPDGWRMMGDLQAGGKVFDEHGNVCEIVAATDVMHGRPCYEVEFSDGTVIVADAEHQWRTSTQQGRWQRGNLERHPNTGRPERRVMLDVNPVTTEQISATLLASRGGSQPPANNHAIEVCGPLDYPKSDLPIAAYTLGAWLGDGRTDFASICNPDEDVLDQIRLDGYVLSKQAQEWTYGILTYDKSGPKPDGWKSFPALLREVGVLGNKHIPEAYLRASIDQRRALLAGLLDTDGMCGKSGQVEIDLCHKQLAADVLDLIRGLGYKATMTTRRVKGRTEESSTCYRMQFVAPEPVFRLPRKGDRQRPVSPNSTSRRRYIVDVRPVESVPVKCIQVDSPSHLYLASSACIPTHNSEALCQVFAIDRWAHFTNADGQPQGMVASFLIDPQQGQSFAPFLDHLAAPVATSLDEAILMVEALTSEMLRRNKYLSRVEYTNDRGKKRRGRKWWNPLIDGPIITLTIDEAHDFLANKQFSTLVTKAARMWRKCGGQIRIATHTPLLSDLGGSMALRDMLSSAFVWVGRTANSLSGPVAFNGRLPADPRQIPEIPGTAYIMAGVNPKPMLARTAYADDYYDWVLDPETDEPIGFPAVLPEITWAAFGSEFAAWVAHARLNDGTDWVPSSPHTPAAPKLDARATDAVVAVLLSAEGPLDMAGLDAGLAARGSTYTTATIRDVLKRLRSEPSQLVDGRGVYELTSAAREELSASMDEAVAA